MELRPLEATEKAAKETPEAVLPFRSKKKLSYSDASVAPSCEKSQRSDPAFNLQTPQKPGERPAHRNHLRAVDEVRRVAGERWKEVAEPGWETPEKIPEKKPIAEFSHKYKSLCDQFDSMVSSIRLLKLKGYPPTFVNISSSVQALNIRGFSHGHLAQLKYLMPEVMDIKTTLSLDERTSCMKPDLLIELKLVSPMDSSKNIHICGFSDLSVMFRSRLADFIRSKLKVDEVPEATLPEPFSQRTRQQISTVELLSKKKCTGPCDGDSSDLTVRDADGPTAAPLGCFSTRFQKHFSRKTPLLASEKTQLLSLTTPQNLKVDDISSPISSMNVTPSTTSSPTRISPLKSNNSKRPLMFSTSMDSTPSKPPVFCQHLESTPISKIHDNCPAAVSTCSKPIVLEYESNPEGLLTSTPNLFTPKRAKMTPKADSMPNVDTPRMKPKALNFLSPFPQKEKDGESRRLSVDQKIIESLPSSLQQPAHARRRKIQKENETGFAEVKLQQKMIDYLPKLFDMVHVIFQSPQCPFMTKEELLHKIVMHHLDIVDKREAEEQLKLLQELTPDWISERMASSGDLIYRINMVMDPCALRAKLVEAGRSDT